MTSHPFRLVLVAAAALAPVAANAQNKLTSAERLSVDSIFARFDRTDSPGCVVGVSRAGKPVYVRGYGMSDLQYRIALSPNSIFHVASVSKQFTAISVAMLAEEGKLSLDDDVRKHVPELHDYGVKLTVRQLIHHTSGLRDQWSLLAYAGWRSDDLITEGDVLDIISRQRGLNFRPGDEYVYSNTGYTLLAVIVKRVSGKSLREFAEERIFAPLGMRDTHFHDDHTMIVPDRTSAYQPRNGGGWSISIPVFDTYGATSLFTTTEDLLKWEAHLDSPAFGSPALWRAAATSALLNDGTPTTYGYGLAMARFRGQEAIGHNGADAGYRSAVERYPLHGLAVTVLCNLANSAPGALSRQVAVALLGDKLPPVPVNARAMPHIATRAALEKWVGTYRDTVSQLVFRVRLSGDTIRANGQVISLGSDTTGVLGTMPGWVALRQGADGRAQIAVEPKALRAIRFIRQESALTSKAALAAFAGSYYSAELDTRYELVLRDTVLFRVHRKMDDAALAPAGRDAFTMGGGSVLFMRDRRGRVLGFTVNDGRVRGVRFTRVP